MHRFVTVTIVGLALALLPAAPASAFTTTPASTPATLNPGAGVAPDAIATTATALCAQVAYKAGFPANVYPDGRHHAIVIAVAVAMAESSCNPSATGSNGPTSGCPSGSNDRGLWQINDCYHPEVSNACAYNAQCNGIGAYRISNGGTNWTPWSTFNSGAYLQYISAAQAAVGGITVLLRSRGANTCLDARPQGVHNGGAVQQYACNANDHFQQWHVEAISGGSLLVLRNVGAGTCLATDGTASTSGSRVVQWACSLTDTGQQWSLRPSRALSSNADALLANSRNHTCLDAQSQEVRNGGAIIQWGCNASDHFQQWS